MDILWQDVRYGVGVLRRNLRSTLVAALTLAVGIAATTVIFSFISALVLRPLPFDDLDRLVVIWETRSESGTERHRVAPANFADWKQRQQLFEDLAAYEGWNAVMTGEGDPERVHGFRVSASLFPQLGIEPLHGRTFRVGEEQPGQDDVVLLGYGFWSSRLGSDPRIVGRSLTLNERRYTVIGIMPVEFDFPLGTDLWTPLALEPREWSERADQRFRVVGRLRPGMSMVNAQVSMSLIANQLAVEYPVTNRETGARALRLLDEVNVGSRKFLVMLLGAAGFLLLLACFNVAHLQLSRAGARHREIAVRLSLGATRARIVRQLVTESLLLSLAGGGLGLLLASWALDPMKAAVPPQIARFVVAGLDDTGLDGRVLLFATVLTLASGILSGLAPALETSNPRLRETLAEGGRSSGITRKRRRLAGFLVVSEVALSIVLLVGAGLMVRGFNHLLSVDRGFDDSRLLTMSVSAPEARYPSDRDVRVLYDDVLERLGELPGAVSIAAVSNLPAVGGTDTRDLTVEDHAGRAPRGAARTDVQIISGGFLAAMRIPLREGRPFSGSDHDESPRVAIVSEMLAHRYWPDSSPVGRRIKLSSADGSAPWLEIVGVAGNVSRGWIEGDSWPTVYLPYRQQPTRDMALVVRGRGDPRALVPAVRTRIWSVDRAMPVYRLTTMRQTLHDFASGIRLAAAMMGIFGLFAFVLCAAGVYALVAQTVTHRTHEVGVRIALGARPRQIMRLFVGQGLRLALLGVGIGLPAALALTQLLSGSLFGVVALHPATILVFVVGLIGATLLASYVPARSASRLDPSDALRYE